MEVMAGDARKLLERISIDANVCFGKPRVRGHRIRVSLILDTLAAGMSFADIRNNFAGIVDDDIRACVAYRSAPTAPSPALDPTPQARSPQLPPQSDTPPSASR